MALLLHKSTSHKWKRWATISNWRVKQLAWKFTSQSYNSSFRWIFFLRNKFANNCNNFWLGKLFKYEVWFFADIQWFVGKLRDSWKKSWWFNSHCLLVYLCPDDFFQLVRPEIWNVLSFFHHSRIAIWQKCFWVSERLYDSKNTLVLILLMLFILDQHKIDQTMALL